MKRYILKLFSEVLGGMHSRGEITAIPAVDVSYPKSNFGDYSTNVALVLAKQLKQSPQQVAEHLVGALKEVDAQNRFEISSVGGFVNFAATGQELAKNLSKILAEENLYGASFAGEGRTVVVEYFQNNVAKPPHVGHLRSAVVGDALLRIFKSQGFKAVSDTHIGDWGVQFGMLIWAYKRYVAGGGDTATIEANPIEELNKLYVQANVVTGDAGTTEQILKERHDLAKLEFKKLEDGDTENRELWQWFVKVSVEDFERYRRLLDLLPFDHNLGESFYEDKMPAVLEEFTSKGLVQVGETGERYVDLESFGLGRCILVKSDGATTYHMRDFATYLYRRGELKFERNIYVVDNRQAHHFRQLFKVLELAGYPTAQDSVHVDLGFMSLPEGPISTRKGNIISLQALMDEGTARAMAIINEKNPELENKAAVAYQVALAAIKYFDLSHNRKTEFTFTWDAALSFEGNTGPYLQYTHARIHGILRKGVNEGTSFQVQGSSLPPGTYDLAPSITVLRKLLKYPEVLEQVTKDYLPNLLCNYLFELSQDFNSFYAELSVLQEPDAAIRNFRLQLITATAQVIKNGLYLLGIEAPEEM